MVDVMHRTSVSIFEAKKEAIQSQSDNSIEKGDRDLLSVLREFSRRFGRYLYSPSLPTAVRANLSASEEDRMPEDELLAQLS